MSARRASVVIGVSLGGPAVVALAGGPQALVGVVLLVVFAAWCIGAVVAYERRTNREALERWREGQRSESPLLDSTPQTVDRWSAGEPGRGRWAV